MYVMRLLFDLLGATYAVYTALFFWQSSFGFNFFNQLYAQTTGYGGGRGSSHGSGNGHRHHPQDLKIFLPRR